MTSRDPTVCDECNELQEVAEDIPMDISDSDSDSDSELLLLPKPIKYQRQNTICGLNIASGCAVYNGNPNGDRLLDEDEDDLSDLPELENIYETNYWKDVGVKHK
jgi:hypothetical protein